MVIAITAGVVVQDVWRATSTPAPVVVSRAGVFGLDGAALAGPATTKVPPTTAPTTTTPTTLGDRSLPAVTLPVPLPLPSDPYENSPETIVGAISIPKLGLDEPLHQGMSLTAINRGPSHWPGTAMPGELGNVVVAGHRTTFSRPFRNLDQLVAGDEVVYSTVTGRWTYMVTAVEVVSPDAVHIADQRPAFTSTLFACHPPGSAAYRIVAHLHLLDDAGLPVAAPEVAVANEADIIAFRR